MRTNLSVVLRIASVILLCNSHAYAQRALDLSTPSGTKLSFTASPGDVITFTLVNKLPFAVYTVIVEERVIPVPVFPKPEGLQGGFADDSCDAILKDAESLAAATSEAQVGEIVQKIRVALAPGACKTPAKLAKINEWTALTIQPLPDRYNVRAGIEIVLTVSRASNTWTLIVSGGERGTWLTTYGISVVPSSDEPHFTKAVESDKFVVTAETELDDVRMIPSVFFSWLPRKRMLGDFAFGPTAGLGLSKDKAALFGGIGLTYNWNLGFITGVAVSPHTRLRGRYTVGEELDEALSDDQVNRDVFRPTWLTAITFRFGGNPFGGGDEDAGGDAGDQSKENAKKQAEAEAQKKKEQAEAEQKKAEAKKAEEKKAGEK